jgi:hypothetical protein
LGMGEVARRRLVRRLFLFQSSGLSATIPGLQFP